MQSKQVAILIEASPHQLSGDSCDSDLTKVKSESQEFLTGNNWH